MPSTSSNQTFREDIVTEDVKPWGRWSTLGLSLIALFGGQGVALSALVWWYGLSLPHWSDLMVDGVLVILSVYIATPVQTALLALMARPTGASAANYLGLTLPRKHDVIIGIVIVTILGAALDGASRLLGFNPVTQFQFDIYRSARIEGWLPWLWLAIVVVGPIGEETLFRGFLFRGWHRSPHDAWVAIIVTALLWALSHAQYNLFFIGQVFVFGLLLGWFRFKSGSTILTILLHGLLNLEAMLETVVGLNNA
jgi:membrane protease YdiL (CAAX protease family)